MMNKKKIIHIFITITIFILLGILLSQKFNYKNKNISIDDLYNAIESFEFNDIDLIALNYEQINSTTIIIGKQAFGSRDYLTENNGESTQRILCYEAKDGTQIIITLGKIITDKNINDNMISLYSDNLKNIGLSYANINYESHIDSSIYLFDNIIVNVVSVNLNNTLDDQLIIKFKENLIEYIKKIE